jgi:hypothetical protein
MLLREHRAASDCKHLRRGQASTKSGYGAGWMRENAPCMQAIRLHGGCHGFCGFIVHNARGTLSHDEITHFIESFFNPAYCTPFPALLIGKPKGPKLRVVHFVDRRCRRLKYQLAAEVAVAIWRTHVSPLECLRGAALHTQRPRKHA